MHEVKVCRGEIVKDPVTGYKFKFTGDCADTIDNVMKDLPPHTRRYLEKRLEIVEKS